MVEIENFSLSYGNGKSVLKGIDLKVCEGEFIVLTGESGSGKSSIINSINGLSFNYGNCTTGGEIKIAGKNIKDLKLWEISKLVSSVFQNPKTHFFNVNTTAELLFFLENNGYSRGEMKKRMGKVLSVFPVSHLLNRDIFSLSGGEKQILSVACAYISGTDVVILDEPSSNLDSRSTDILSKMLSILKKEGKTIIISEHRLYYLMDMADRIIIVGEGKIKKDFSVCEFCNISEKELQNMGLRKRYREEITVRESVICGDLSLQGIEYTLNNKDRRLSYPDMSFMRGKIYGIQGFNGRGKSTFLKIVTGLLRNSSGKIEYSGKKFSRRERIKISDFVMQDVNSQLFTDSVENELKLSHPGISSGEVKSCITSLGLEGLGDIHPMALSGGQKQRIACASCYLSDSAIKCFDEPTSGMDYKNMAGISDLLKMAAQQKGSIVLVSSHDNEFINMTADYLINLS